MAGTAINTDLETRALLSEQADAASIPRARFVAILAKRYGWRQVEDLTEPVRVEPAFDPQVAPDGIITVMCLECEWRDRGFVHEVQRVAKEHHEKTGHRVGPFGAKGVGPMDYTGSEGNDQ